MIQISLERRSLHLSRKEQALASAAAQRSTMQFQFQKQIAAKAVTYRPLNSIHIQPSALKFLIQKYSEQLVYKPLDEIQYWFAYSAGAFLEPGYVQLYYYAHLLSGKKIPPSKSAVAAIGEGTAGLLGQWLYQGRKLARPNHDYPDIVMEAQGKTLLIEAKATSGSVKQAENLIENDLARMAAYAFACAELDSRPVIGILVSTALIRHNHFHTYITEVVI